MIQRASNEESAAQSVSAPAISLDRFVRTLEDMLVGSTQSVVVYGPSGIGKSTLLHQFLQAHPLHTVALFLSGASRWGYEPADLALRMAEQVATLLDLSDDLDSDPSQAFVQLRRYFTRLRQASDRNKATYYFILDGLEDIPSGAEVVRRQVVDLLPIGMTERFRFIISAEQGLREIPLDSGAAERAREFMMSGFDRADVRHYLSEFTLDDLHIDEVMRVTRGVPQSLVAVRRLMLRSNIPGDVAMSLPESAPELFRLQWVGVDAAKRSHALPLAVLAFEAQSRSVADLAELTGTPAGEIEKLFRSLPFLVLDENGYWNYSSASDVRFAETYLADLRQDVHDAFIERLQREPEAPGSLANLPSHLMSAGRTAELLEYLTAARFARLYETAPSLATVRRRADEGIQAADSLRRHADLLRFILQKAAVQEIASSATAVSEVRALGALGDLETATAVAESAPRLEDKFRLLAAVARARSEAGRPADSSLTTRLHGLFHQIDPDMLGDQRVETALDLLATLPELAVELVSFGRRQGENSMDWSLAALVIQAQAAKQDAETDVNVERIRQRIEDPAAQRLSMTAMAVLGRVSGTEVIRRADAMETTSDKLYILQHWIMANRTAGDAADVLERAFEIALQSGEYRVNASTFRQLASCLPYIESLHVASYYVDRFRALRAALEQQGPPEEYFRLQLIVARTLWKWDQSAARDQFLEIYNDATKLADPVVRTSVMARIAAATARVDPARRLDDDLSGAVDAELDNGITQLLTFSAEHYDVSRGVIRALAVSRPSEAISIAKRLNTEWRRDAALRDFVEAVSDAPVAEIPTVEIVHALDEIADVLLRDLALENSIRLFVEKLRATDLAPRFHPILQRVSDIRDASDRARVLSLVLGSLGSAHTLAGDFRDQLEAAWTAIDDGWPKLDVGADIITNLARNEKECAREYVTKFNALKGSLGCRDPETATAGAFGLHLAIRALCGLVQHRVLTAPSQEERLVHAILQCGAVGDQASLLASLCIRFYFADERTKASAVADRLSELLEGISTSDLGSYSRTMVLVWPALYLSAPGTADVILSRLLPHDRDAALYTAGWVLLTRVPPGDAYELDTGDGYNVPFEDILRIVYIMRSIDSDTYVYALLQAIVASSTPKRTEGRAVLTKVQRATVIQQLEDLIRAKFPSPRFISHEGFTVAAHAEVNRLREGSKLMPLSNLLAQARTIPNVADRAYVLAILARSARSTAERERILAEAETVLESIPMLRDRVDLYQHFSEFIHHVDPERAKRYIKRATEMIVKGEGESLEERRRSMIDLAYRIDPEFASTIAAAFDDDPGKRHVSRQVRIHDIVRSLSRPSQPKTAVSLGHAKEYAHAAWSRLSLLQAGKANTVRPQDLLPLLRYAAPLPMSYAYPIVALFLENAIRRLRYGAADVKAYVAPMFEAVMQGAELAVHIPASRRSQAPLAEGDATEGTFVVGVGERSDALKVMRDWLQGVTGCPLYILEPYFHDRDVGALHLIREFDADWEVILVSGMESLKNSPQPYRETYRRAWRDVSTDDPPAVNLVFVGRTTDGKCPIHDRWWLTENCGGLSLGTSYNGFGLRLSTIRVMPQEEATMVLERLRPLFAQKRIVDGERLEYEAFSL